MKHLFLALLLLETCVCIAQQQSNPYMIKVGTVSPEAASLGKFGNIPVNHSTGIPSITIPVYEINIGKTKVPISIDYHAGGIRLDEVASSVGLGWALECGGMISRNVMGLPDDDGSFGYLAAPNFAAVIAQPENYRDYITHVVDGQHDAIQDQFSYSLTGTGGKFIFKQDASVFQFPVTTNKIERYYDNSGVKFKITDDKGSIYLFERSERYDPGSVHNQVYLSYLNVWHLTKIIDPNMTDTIFFNYEATCGNVSFESIVSGMYRIGTTASCNVTSSDVPLAGLLDVDEASELHQNNTFTPYYLSEITWRGGKITFTNMCDRLDRTSEKRLSEMTIFAYDGTVQTPIKKVKFFHSYFISSKGIPHNTYGTAVQEDKYRLRLDSVGFYSVNAADQPQMSRMQYDNTELASRETYAQDVWGFNNGQWSNGSLMAKQLIRGYRNSSGIYIDIYKYIGSANRDANESYMKAGTLKSLQYPTGGRTELEMEPHQYSTGQPSLVTQSTYCDATGTINQTASTSFTPDASWQNIRYSCYFSSFNYSGVTDRPRGNITDQTTGQVIVNFYSHTDPNQSSSCGLLPLPLIPGHTYTINLNIYTTTASAVNANVTVTWEKASNTIEIKKGGGLRVKTIRNYDNTGDLVNQETYTYGENESGVGILSIPHTYFSMNKEDIRSRANCPSDGIWCRDIIGHETEEYHAGSLFPVSQVAGSPILYSSVTRYQLDFTGGKTNGKTVYNYSVYQDVQGVPGPDIAQAGMKMISNSWRNGRLDKESIYKSDRTGGYTLKEVKEYQYVLSRKATQDCLKIKGKYSESPGDRCYPLSTLTGEVYVSAYTVETGAYLIQSTKTTGYDDNGAAFTTTQNHVYADTTHLFPTSNQTTSSKGETVTGNMKYPRDLSASGNVYEKMITRNIISPVVTEQKLLGGVQQSLTTIHYDDWYSNSKLLQPYKIDLQVALNTTETKVRFNKFDKYGNVLQQQKENDTYQSYIWDYQSVYPIAQCINAAYDSMAYSSFETDGNGNWTIGSKTRVPGGVTGSNCYQLSNGGISKTGLSATATYIVSYWTANTTPFTITGTQGTAFQGKKIGSWTYFEHKVTGVSQLSVPQVSGLIDELRLYPANGQMTTYSYAPLKGMTSACVSNNTITYYVYDGMGRLKLIKDQDGNVIKTFEYHYKQ